MFFLTVILVGISALLYVWWFFKSAWSFFQHLGIPYLQPKSIFGSVPEAVRQKKPYVWVNLEIYRRLEPHKLGGLFTFHKPSLMIRDPELIKHVLIKDFEYFRNRGGKVNKEMEPLGIHLANLQDEEWKNLRVKLTSTFTSGKMKMMIPLVKDCGVRMTRLLDYYATNSEEFIAEGICSQFTLATIASCAFGIETDVMENPKSEFAQNAYNSFKLTRRQVLKNVLFPNMPTVLMKFFNIYITEPRIASYFQNLVKNMVDYREKNKVTRNDFLDLLIAMKNNTELTKLKCQEDAEDLKKFLEQIGEKHVKSDLEMTTELMAAQCFIFFVAGFGGASSALSFTLYELALHPDIQSKARNEIKEVLQNIESDDEEVPVTYDLLKRMTYLEMIIDETLRRYPVATGLGRKCSRAYKVPNSNMVIPEGMSVQISVLGLHYDKKYYEKPDEFYPEHFTAEAKAKRPNYTYLPFGDGPRICIGERFARMQVKVGLVYLLSNYEYTFAPRTKVPLEYQTDTQFSVAKGGIWLKCCKVTSL